MLLVKKIYQRCGKNTFKGYIILLVVILMQQCLRMFCTDSKLSSCLAEVVTAIHKQKLGKAPGADGIHGEATFMVDLDWQHICA